MVADHLKTLECGICFASFALTIIGCLICSDKEGKLLSFPAGFGGLGIFLFSVTGSFECKEYKKITSSLFVLIKEHSFLHYHFVKDTQQKKKTDAKN